MTRLRNHTQCPPGEFFIKARVQGGRLVAVHGHCAEPDCHRFGPSPLIQNVVKEMRDFIIGNGLTGSDYITCLQMIDEYTCTRLGSSNRWCQGSEKPYSESRAAQVAIRGGCCGAKI